MYWDEGMDTFNNSIKFQRLCWNYTLKHAKIIVDATCGNGYDTKYLYQHARDGASIYAIDIQEEAISATKKQIATLPNRKISVAYFHGGHESILSYGIPTPYDMVVFNLGYLPRFNHDIMTTPHTTIAAIKACMMHLAVGGMITVVAYPGTIRGAEEKEEIASFLRGVNQESFSVSHWLPMNQKNHPSELFIITRR